jgi:lysine 2,3-aminomutase
MEQQTEIAEPQEPPSQQVFFPEAEEEPPGRVASFVPSPDATAFPPPNILPFPLHRQQTVTGRDTGRQFRRRFFPDISAKQWNDWHWQVANRIRTLERLQNMLILSMDEREALERSDAKLPVGITPYYLSLIPPDDPGHPLRRAVIPTVHEFTRGPGEGDDPLGEEAQSPVPGLVHRYPDRVLFLVHDFCSTYCRYCTRSRVVGHGAVRPERSRFERILNYIRNNPSIRDVILSGGDPLLLSDERLEWLLNQLRLIPHVEVIRIGTKIPAVLPQRVTKRLVSIIKRYHPVWMSLHFMHPEDCTAETQKACGMLADGGIPLGSQTVLLQGINDEVETMKQLMQNLMRMRVRPYYLYQCDPISGSAHFRTPVEKGLEIIRGLRGFTSGYAVPTYVIDAPGGGGKIPLMPEAVVGRAGDDLVLRNYERKCYRYPDVV